MRFEHAFEAEVWLYAGDKAAWHFITVPKDVSADIRMLSAGMTGGFGSVKVAAKIGGTRWTTSIFPESKSKCFMLPLKAEVRKAEKIKAGDCISVRLETSD